MPSNDHTLAGEQQAKDDGGFENIPISRRDFARLSLATAGALTLPKNALADHTSPKTTELYDFIRNHVTEEYAIPSLIRLRDETGFDALSRLDFETNDEKPVTIRQTTTPEIAAYAKLTPEQVSDVLEIDEVTEVSFSPGSNPFWKLGNYENGVFPDPFDSVGFIAFEQMVGGLKHLESQHEDRLNFYSVGQSAGHHNLFTGESDPQDMWIAEITNDITDEEEFQEKEKAVFGLSIHGDERVGVEAGSRLIESILEDDEPEINTLLDDVVIVCVFANPDGWVVSNPQYIGQDNDYERQNAAEVDLNRSFPVAGWMDPANYPAEPDGANLIDDQPGEIDDDVPEEIIEHVPDALAVTEHLRKYSNVDALVDIHNMGTSDEFVYSIDSTPARPEQLHDMNELDRIIGEYVYNEIGSIEENLDSLSEAINYPENGDDQPDPDDLLPERLYDYGGVVDTLGYATSGAFPVWASAPEEYGGLDTVAITTETVRASSLDRTDSPEVYVPEFEDIQVRANMAIMRATVTHVSSQIDVAFESENQPTAYVTSDALTQSSDDLVFADTEVTVQTTTISAESGEGDDAVFTVPEETTEISVHVEHEGDIIATLLDPMDDQVHSYNSTAEKRCKAQWMVTDPAAGDWTVRIENTSDTEISVDVSTNAVITTGGVLTPDPRTVLGYEQRQYTATPFQYFDDYSNHLEDNTSEELDPVSMSEVQEGALRNGNELAYDNLIVIHDDGISDQPYIKALDDFVKRGGNLILTDRGVHLLGYLQNELADDIGPNDVSSIESLFPLLDESDENGKNLDHNLLNNVRPIERELWNVPSVGYASPESEAPMTLVDSSAFETAGGSIAATTEGQVSIGTLEHDDSKSGIQVIGSLLPPPNQRHLHPFGMNDYSLGFMGQTVFTNSLNYEQQRLVDGEVTDLWREPETATPD